MELDLQAVCDQSRVHRDLGLRISDVPPGVRLRAEVGAAWAHDAGGQVVHGGLIALLLDAATTLALVATTGHDWMTVNLRVDYLRPLAIGSVEARAEAVTWGTTLGRSRAILEDGQGKQVALATATSRRGPKLVGADGG